MSLNPALRELALCYARAAVDALLAESQPTPKTSQQKKKRVPSTQKKRVNGRA